MKASGYPQSIMLGAMYLIAAAMVFSVGGLLVKDLLADLPVVMLVFFRNAVALSLFLPMLFFKSSFSLRTKRLGPHAFRATAGVMAMYCFFYAISKLPLAEAVSLNFTSPLFIPLVAFLLLGERPGRVLPWVLLVGFGGSLLVIKPGSGTFQLAALVGVISAIFAAVSLVNVRRLAETEPAYRIVFYFALIGSILSIGPMLPSWQMPTLKQGLMLTGVGLFATAGQWLLTRGYASAPAGQVGYYQYSAVVFAGLLDWFVWQARPDGFSLIGMSIVCIAGVVASRIKPPPLPVEAE